jgi:hypothetical protein
MQLPIQIASTGIQSRGIVDTTQFKSIIVKITASVV